MFVDMRKIDEWVESSIAALVGSSSRLRESEVYYGLNPYVTMDLAHSEMLHNHPEWMSLSRPKRQNRIRKALDRLVRNRCIEIRNESGVATYSEGYTRYIYEIGALDRIVAHLGDVDV